MIGTSGVPSAPVTSCVILSPYFFGAIRAISHFLVSTRSRERFTNSLLMRTFPVSGSTAASALSSSAISRICSAKASARLSIARVYCSENGLFFASQPNTVAEQGIPSSRQIERRLSPSAIREQIRAASSSVKIDGRPVFFGCSVKIFSHFSQEFRIIVGRTDRHIAPIAKPPAKRSGFVAVIESDDIFSSGVFIFADIASCWPWPPCDFSRTFFPELSSRCIIAS